jgi:hypothetical protein
MFCGDDVLYNDDQVALLKEASRKAAQGWRFRNVKPPGIRALSAFVQDLLDAARRGIDAVRHKTEQVRGQRPLTLTEQR